MPLKASLPSPAQKPRAAPEFTSSSSTPRRSDRVALRGTRTLRNNPQLKAPTRSKYFEPSESDLSGLSDTDDLATQERQGGHEHSGRAKRKQPRATTGKEEEQEFDDEGGEREEGIGGEREEEKSGVGSRGYSSREGNYAGDLGERNYEQTSPRARSDTCKRRESKGKSPQRNKKAKLKQPDKHETKAGLRAGEIFIPKRLPPKGNREFTRTTIHPSTVDFLRDLAANNDRGWFAEHDGLYRAAKQDFDSLVEELSHEIILHVDSTVPELPLKDVVFRIYRDIRFSNDHTPYKIYFSAAWSRVGRKGPYAHYYLQIQPNGKSMVGGGIWHAESQPLSLIRRDIDRRPHRLKSILTTDGIAKEFLGMKDPVVEDEVVQSFIDKNSEDALKSAPKGYSRDHANIGLLRLRTFTVGKRLEDSEVTSPHILSQIVGLFAKMEPLISYLNSVVMPDINVDDSTEGEESDT